MSERWLLIRGRSGNAADRGLGDPVESVASIIENIFRKNSRSYSIHFAALFARVVGQARG
jgi:hypothetical protein